MQMLSDTAWKLIKDFFPISNRGRPIEHQRRAVVEGILYVVKAGCQWRMLPPEYPPWQSVYGYFRKWQRLGIIQRLLDCLRQKYRTKVGKRSSTIAIVDSQSVKSGCNKGRKGYDGNKRVKGRKRHFIFDSLGLLIRIFVTKANHHDKPCANIILQREGIGSLLPSLKQIHADKAYYGLRIPRNVKLIIAGSLGPGFVPIPHRWKAERSLAWQNGFRRLSKDYEELCQCSQEMIRWAFLELLLRRFGRENY